jgi:hypothetical protein
MLGPLSAPNVEQPFAFDVRGAAFRVFKILVATIDNYVTRLHVWQQLLDQIVDGRTSFDEHHYFSRSFQRRNQLSDTMTALKVLPFRATFDQFINLLHRAIENRHPVTAAFHVEGQVLTHYRQTNQTKITVRAH